MPSFQNCLLYLALVSDNQGSVSIAGLHESVTPKQNPFHWKNPLLGSWREEVMARPVCFSSGGPLLGAVLNFLAGGTTGADVWSTRALCRWDEQTMSSGGFSLPLSWRTSGCELHDPGIRLMRVGTAPSSCPLSRRAGQGRSRLAGRSGGCVRRAKAVHGNHEEISISVVAKRGGNGGNWTFREVW